MSMMSDSTILACHQRASGSKTVEKRVSTIILNVYQSTGIEKEDGSRLSLENHRKLDEVRRFFNKKFEEEHDVHRNLASSEQYSRPSEKGEYQYVSGVMGIAYNPFLDSETGGAHRNHEVAELLKFWTEKIMEIDAVEKERPSLGLFLEKTPEVVSIPRSNKRVEVNMGDGNGLLITNLGVVWKLLRPSWCPHPHASLIEETTERVRLAPTEDEDLAKLSVVHKLILPQMKESGEKTNSLESAKKMEPGSCLDSTCGSGEHTCDGRSCVRILSFQKEDLVTWFEDITEREKSEVQIVAECYARTTVNIATALGFFSRMCSLQSLERLESEHHLVTALSVESWPGVLQVTQKHIRSWKVGLEAEMGFPMSEAYGLPLNAKSLIGSMMANLCGSHYPQHMAMVEASNQRILVDKAFSVPKCVSLARVSHHSHKLLRKIRGTVPKKLRDDLSEIWGEELLKLDVALPGYTPTSTSSDSQVSGGSSRLKELGEKLRQRSRESSARPELPPTWREQPVRSVVISSYKKSTEKRYHRHNRLNWNAEQKARRDCFHDAAWVEYLAPPRVSEGAVHLIIGDSLVRVLTRIQSHWQTGILSFAGAATPQMLATLEMLGMT